MEREVSRMQGGLSVVDHPGPEQLQAQVDATEDGGRFGSQLDVDPEPRLDAQAFGHRPRQPYEHPEGRSAIDHTQDARHAVRGAPDVPRESRQGCGRRCRMRHTRVRCVYAPPAPPGYASARSPVYSSGSSMNSW